MGTLPCNIQVKIYGSCLSFLCISHCSPIHMKCSTLDVFLFSMCSSLLLIPCFALRVQSEFSQVRSKVTCSINIPMAPPIPSQSRTSSLCILKGHCSTVALILTYYKFMYIFFPITTWGQRLCFIISLSPMPSTELAAYTIFHKFGVT